MRLVEDAVSVFRAAVGAADPYAAVTAQLRLEGEELVLGPAGGGETRVPLPAGRVIVVGAGKGAAPMARAVEEILGTRVWGGLVCVKDGHGLPLRRVEVVEAAHPVPDARGAAAAGRILDLAREAGPEDLILAVLSGGGSALLARPARGVGLEDLEALNRELLACGASIGEVNALRKHLSAVAGGRLGAEAWPARVVALVLSDVVGDRLDVIGSGPFAADPTTFAQCSAIIGRYALRGRLPPAVLRAVESGERGERPETVKPGDGRLDRVRHVVVGSNRLSLDAAARRARDLGYAPMVLSSMLEGEARQAAKFLAAVAKECGCSGTPLPPPACLLAGGETTVTLTGEAGVGGRNQELALALALELEGWPRIVGLSGGTDGTDGPTDAAGAVATAETAERARRRGADPREFLDRHDSHRFFEVAGGMLRTGPTLTNVMDVQVLLVGGGAREKEVERPLPG